MISSAIYEGSVYHRRIGPPQHLFRYRVWWLLLDLEDLAVTTSRLRLFSHNSPNVFAMCDKDFGDGNGTLREQILRRIADTGIDATISRISLFAMPRLLGHSFNPLSVYFCYGKDQRLRAIVYEVHNTFGERHSYVCEAEFDRDGISRHQVPKDFYVSPFMKMNLTYDFQVQGPADRISIRIVASNEDGPVIDTSLSGHRRPLSDRQLLSAFVTHPLVTVKVISAIHWEALRLWLKKYRVVARHAENSHRVSVARRHQNTPHV